MFFHFQAHGLRQAVQLDDFIERRFVERATDKPAVASITVEVLLAQVLDPDEASVAS